MPSIYTLREREEPNQLHAILLSLPSLSTEETMTPLQIALVVLAATLVLIAGIAVIRVVVQHAQETPPRTIDKSSSSSIKTPESENPEPVPQQSVTVPRLPDLPADCDNDSFVRLPYLDSSHAGKHAQLSFQAGFAAARKRAGSKSELDSESEFSSITSSAEEDTLGLCGTASANTSMTSVTDSVETQSLEAESDLEGLDVELELGEVKKASTQSMEVKRGILVSWRLSFPSDYSSMPTVVVSEALDQVEDTLPISSPSTTKNGFLSPSSTFRTQNSLDSCASSVSVDLDQFPLPPVSPYIISLPLPLDDRLEFQDTFTDSERRMTEKRSTVEHVIMLYA
ncbi:hypothetical protein VNI00_011801 [Paramarasmius palmivorus]|uniref:Uncharacterized protein n=1 Tax=Paramarasmius palmivorus TaxID=297713 RepID=A0AAW0CAC8_9AGAR